MRKPDFFLCDNKGPQLICAFVFAKRIVQSLLLINPKFQASRFFPESVQAGLCQTCSETTLLVFPQSGSYDKMQNDQLCS